MDPKRQREIALGTTAVLLVAIAVWAMQGSSAPNPGATSARGTVSTAQAGPKISVTEVDLKALEVERPEPEEGTRNPFRFKPKPAPPPPPPSAAVIRQQEQAAAAAQAAQPVGPPPPPRIPLKYIGDMKDPKNAGKRIAILSDTRGAVSYGREGEVIEGRYQILRIGVESIELAYLDGRGRQTIRQTGQ
jgi:hypothetical protein